MKAIYWILLLFAASPSLFGSDLKIPDGFATDSLIQDPASFKGRFRPVEAYARLWLYDFYHRESIKPEHRPLFLTQDGSAIEFLWKIHFLGHEPWDNAPLFWIHHAEIKELLGLDVSQDRFSYNSIRNAVYESKEFNLKIMQMLLPYFFWKNAHDPANRSRSGKQELTQLSPGLWAVLDKGSLIVLASPSLPPWNFLEPGYILAKDAEDTGGAYPKYIIEEMQNLIDKLNQFASLNAEGSPEELAFLKAYREMLGDNISLREIAQSLELQHPLNSRLRQAGTTLKMLPSKYHPGEWLSLKALRTMTFNPHTLKMELAGNFTGYPEALFHEIRETYFRLESEMQRYNESTPLSMQDLQPLSAKLGSLLAQGYNQIAGRAYREAEGKTLRYPTWGQLNAEIWYYQYPFLEICLLLYGLALGAFIFSWSLHDQRMAILGMICIGGAFMMHTFILGLRCYILNRPPVSNMFETVIYVPWIAVLGSIFAYWMKPNKIWLISSTLVSLLLLVVLKLTQLNGSLENVQAVLDSQYWLIIHVLMVVGSYGIFILCGILGHIYLAGRAYYGTETPALRFTANFILQTMYAGVALLIPGTVLGGVWAAESWGRFWDWDPKESWAFISICVYIIWVHAHTFHKIHNLGLAAGAISGLMAISFTWYGVNYILGTGLHTYGFGSGGEKYYYYYLFFEAAFLLSMAFLIKFRGRQNFLLAKK